MSSWCTPRGPLWFASHVSMCWMLRSCNLSWFVCNVFICRRSTACAFICQCHWGSSSAPSLWILSCTLDESIAQAPLHCCHRHLLYLVLIALLLPLLHGISPVYSIEHIPNLPLLYLVLIAPNFRCFGHKFLWETSIDFILDSLESELHGAFEYPKIYCNFLLRSSRILMRIVSSCEFIRRCQWSQSCGLWSVLSCVLGFKVITIDLPAHSMASMMCLLHDSCFTQGIGLVEAPVVCVDDLSGFLPW